MTDATYHHFDARQSMMKYGFNFHLCKGKGRLLTSTSVETKSNRKTNKVTVWSPCLFGLLLSDSIYFSMVDSLASVRPALRVVADYMFAGSRPLVTVLWRTGIVLESVFDFRESL